MKIKVLETDICKEFKCIGDKCTNTCCAGWRVYIDRDTYEKYRSSKDPETIEKMNKYLVRNRDENKSNFNYGIMKLCDNARCPFLNDKNLCDIVIKEGPESLSKVCTTFPRTIITKNDEELERTIDMSCIEAARILVSKEEPIKFISTEEEKNDKFLMSNASCKKNEDRYFNNTCDLLRRECIAVMQDVRYSFNQRMFRLGVLLNHLEKVITKYSSLNETAIEQIKKYIKEFENEDLSSVMKGININYELQIQVANALVTTITQSKCAPEIRDTLLDLVEVTTSDNNKSFIDTYKNLYIPFLKEHSIILENYYTNHIFLNRIPLQTGNAVFNDYKRIIINYLLLKNIIISNLAKKGEMLSLDEITKIINIFDRGYKHNSFLNKNLTELLEVNNFNDMAHFALLLKVDVD